jgi:hypothetical protein
LFSWLIEMPSLSETLARKRVTYRRPILTLPNIVVIDVPSEFAHPDLSLGRYYAIMVESGAEARELNAFLDADREFLRAPDLLDHRSSALDATRITLARYEPPIGGWPFVFLCHWPSAYAAAVPERTDLFARGVYTIEMFEDADALSVAAATLIETLASRGEVAFTAIDGETMGTIGRA